MVNIEVGEGFGDEADGFGEEADDITTDALAQAVTSTQALRAGEIIRSLREFIRRGEADRQPETVSTLLSEGVALAFIGINSRGIDMDIAVDPRVGRIMANRVQVQQVMLQL